MSSASSSLKIILIAQKFSSYFFIFTFIVGTTSNILNILVFTSLKLFRNNQCVFYLIVESFANMGLLLCIFCIEIPLAVSGTNSGTTSLVWCKLRTVLRQTFRLISTLMICFAAFDQFLSTNPRPYLRK